MISLNASGFSITLLKASLELLKAINAPVSAVGWPQIYSSFQPYQGDRVIASAAPQQVIQDVSGPKREFYLSHFETNLCLTKLPPS